MGPVDPPAFAADPGLAGLTGPAGFTRLSSSGRVIGRAAYGLIRAIHEQMIGSGPVVSGHNMALTRAAWLQIRDAVTCGDDAISEDLDVTLALVRFGQRIGYEPGMLVTIGVDTHTPGWQARAVPPDEPADNGKVPQRPRRSRQRQQRGGRTSRPVTRLARPEPGSISRLNLECRTARTSADCVAKDGLEHGQWHQCGHIVGAAGEQDVLVHGAATAQRAIAADLLDEIDILLPVLLEHGRRLLSSLVPQHRELEQLTVRAGEGGVTHLRYRLRRPTAR